jgi:hypothetical protein
MLPWRSLPGANLPGAALFSLIQDDLGAVRSRSEIKVFNSSLTVAYATRRDTNYGKD